MKHQGPTSSREEVEPCFVCVTTIPRVYGRAPPPASTAWRSPASHSSDLTQQPTPRPSRLIAEGGASIT